MLLLSLFFFFSYYNLGVICKLFCETQERKARGKTTPFLHFIALSEAWLGFIKSTVLVFP